MGAVSTASVTDGLQSFVSGLGTSRDKAATTFYGVPMWTDDQLVNAYRSSWIARKIVDVPALDSCRRWRSWQAEQDQIEAIEAEEKRLGLKAKTLEARIKARLFGGAALLIGTGDANPAEPLDPARIGKDGIKYLTVLTRRQLAAGDIETDPLSPLYGQPKFYQVSGAAAQVTIHPSRLVRFIGAPHPDEDLAVGANKGWGESVLVAAMEAVKQVDGSAANVASLIFEASVDVIRIPDFMASLASPDYEARLLKRFGLAMTAKGINRALILDKEEEFEKKTVSFATLPDVMDRFMQLASGAADIPATRLLGQSPAGMSATGESDLRNYYDRISAGQELEMTPAMEPLDECIIRSALGARPQEVHFIWSSLWQISDIDRSKIGESIANTISKLESTGLYPQEALAKAGANTLVEHSILPGLEEAIEEAGGLPDYDAELQAEQESEMERLAAQGQQGAPGTSREV
ncbi:phage portal protein [Aquabacter sp. CN5-332]|uniref:DUF1073 domain-containing protein n=1 Tax=Aquabacter sp. CN5-332 TaxID=3156608 RepID=UPI0032B3C00A